MALLTHDTAVGGHHQRMGPWIFDNVLPMDGVCTTQEPVPVNVHTSTQDLCEVFQTQLPQAEVSITSVVEEDCEGVAVLVQLGSSDDPQVLQWQVVKLVQSHQHIACHFSNRSEEGEVSTAVDACDLKVAHYDFTVLVVFPQGAVLLLQV